MPKYDYECKECKHNWTEDQKMSEEPKTKCPKCEKESAQRLISKSNFILKGSGWFKSGGY